MSNQKFCQHCGHKLNDDTKPEAKASALTQNQKYLLAALKRGKFMPFYVVAEISKNRVESSIAAIRAAGHRIDEVEEAVTCDDGTVRLFGFRFVEK